MKPCPFCAEEIQDAAIKCKHCGEGPESVQSPSSNFGPALLIVAGTCAAVYALQMDVTVPVPEKEFMGQRIGGGRVNNIGLLQDRQNYLTLSGIALVCGILLAVVASRSRGNTPSRARPQEEAPKASCVKSDSLPGSSRSSRILCGLLLLCGLAAAWLEQNNEACRRVIGDQAWQISTLKSQVEDLTKQANDSEKARLEAVGNSAKSGNRESVLEDALSERDGQVKALESEVERLKERLSYKEDPGESESPTKVAQEPVKGSLGEESKYPRRKTSQYQYPDDPFKTQ